MSVCCAYAGSHRGLTEALGLQPEVHDPISEVLASYTTPSLSPELRSSGEQQGLLLLSHFSSPFLAVIPQALNSL